MLTRARSLFSRVFSLDTPSTQTRLGDVFDDIDDDTSDDNDIDNTVDDDIENSTNGVDNDDGGLSDSDDEWSIDSRQSSIINTKTKGKYERQINECPTHSTSNSKTKSNLNYARSHEKSKQTRLLSAMQVATSRCNVESMKRLLNNFEMNINHRDQYGMSYLEHAILMGSFDMVDLLIRYGCDLYQG
jgi:ankyrin repeat protein